MSRYFNWVTSLKRIVRGDIARADDVNGALDELSAGLDSLDVDVDRAIKLPIGSNMELSMTPGQRAGLVLAFDGAGNLIGLTAGWRWRGNWVTGAAYVTTETFRDPATGNIYAAVVPHTSSTVASDVADGKIALMADLASVGVSTAAAAASAASASSSSAEAKQWATQITPEVVAGQGYGARKYAQDAAASASAASTSATTASNAAISAQAAESAASGAATVALTAEANASTSAGNAAASAAAAAGSAQSYTTLADQAASSTLPSTAANTPFSSLHQTARNALKWLVAKFDTGGEVDIKWDIPSGSTNALVLSDRGRAVTITANTTIPTNASVAYPTGAAILLVGDSTGRVITGPAASSLTIEGVASAQTSFTMKPNKSCVIRKTGTNTWRVFGDVT